MKFFFVILISKVYFAFHTRFKFWGRISARKPEIQWVLTGKQFEEPLQYLHLLWLLQIDSLSKNNSLSQ
uniref:Putative secreted protein n=1 Tax=Panstrongylus lignarius TaxID=156445 RepID=A0A224Y1E7_9HEMI